jgi:hypothetical protein
MTNIFCPKCHKPAAQIKRTEEKVEVLQNGKVLLSLSAQSRGVKIGTKCPDGHHVDVEI